MTMSFAPPFLNSLDHGAAVRRPKRPRTLHPSVITSFLPGFTYALSFSSFQQTMLYIRTTSSTS